MTHLTWLGAPFRAHAGELQCGQCSEKQASGSDRRALVWVPVQARARMLARRQTWTGARRQASCWGYSACTSQQRSPISREGSCPSHPRCGPISKAGLYCTTALTDQPRGELCPSRPRCGPVSLRVSVMDAPAVLLSRAGRTFSSVLQMWDTSLCWVPWEFTASFLCCPNPNTLSRHVPVLFSAVVSCGVLAQTTGEKVMLRCFMPGLSSRVALHAQE